MMMRRTWGIIKEATEGGFIDFIRAREAVEDYYTNDNNEDRIEWWWWPERPDAGYLQDPESSGINTAQVRSHHEHGWIALLTKAEYLAL